MRVLLVQPNQEQGMGLQHLDRVEPLGLEMIAGGLQDRHEVAILDMRVEQDSLASTLADFQPQVVGVSSTFTVGIYQALNVAEVTKATCPRAFVVMGGHHPSLYPMDFRNPAVDAIVVGEGEITTQELVDCLAVGDDPARVPGLVLNLPQGQQLTGQRSLLQNLDNLPHPSRSLTHHLRQHYHLFLRYPVAAVETTRGCPYRCSFCAVWRFYQEQVRFKSPQRVYEELEAIEEPSVLFTDDNFLANTKRAEEIARLIQMGGIRKSYYMQARSDAIVRHPEVIASWREVGLDGVFIGFEKPNQNGLDMLNKHNSVENNEQALEILRQQGIEPNTSFIISPDDSHDDFASLRSYMRHLNLKVPLFAILTPLPGTALFDEVKERITTNDYQLFDLLHAVLPTRLPLTEFYQEFVSLYQKAYPLWKRNLVKFYIFLRSLWTRSSEQFFWQEMLAEISNLMNVQAYLAQLNLHSETQEK